MESGRSCGLFCYYWFKITRRHLRHVHLISYEHDFCLAIEGSLILFSCIDGEVLNEAAAVIACNHNASGLSVFDDHFIIFNGNKIVGTIVGVMRENDFKAIPG